MHVRRKHIDAIKQQLKIIANNNGYSGVWNQRTGPSRQSFPAITFYAESETNENLSIHTAPRPQDRILTISITAWVKEAHNDEKIETDLDNCAESIEIGITNPTGSDDIMLIETTFLSDDTDPQIHSVTLTYELMYPTIENNPI